MTEKFTHEQGMGIACPSLFSARGYAKARILNGATHE